MDVSGIFNALLTNVSNLTYVGTEQLRDLATYYIRGTVGPEALALFHPGSEDPTVDGTVDVWVDTEGFLMRQLRRHPGTGYHHPNGIAFQ